MKSIIHQENKLAPAILFALAGFSATQAQAIDFSFSDLDSLGDLSVVHSVRGLNNLGQVVGDSGGKGVIYSNGSWSVLPTIPGYSQFSAQNINDAGQIAGLAARDGVDAAIAVRWESSAVQPTFLESLVPFDEAPYDFGYAINSAGAVAGTSFSLTGTFNAALWPAGGSAITDLGMIGSGFTYVWNHGINDAGTVVGTGPDANGDAVRGAAWVNGAPAQLLTNLPNGLNSEANTINNLGQIGGASNNGATDASGGFINVPVIWNDLNAAPTLLGTLGGSRGMVFSINDSGQAVGFSETADGKAHPTLWADGQVIDLMDFIPAELKAAGWATVLDIGIQSSSLSSDWIAINDKGAVVTMLYDGKGHAIPALLTPVPVPAAVWLFGSALAGLVGIRRGS